MLDFRIGQGFDAHRFNEGDHIILGGVRIPFDYGLEAHSDGDVLIHALCDALLGAAALGDIGQHFPDHDPQYHCIDSRILLRQSLALVEHRGWQVHNTDMTIIAQKPKLSPYMAEMRQHLAKDLQLSPERLNIKATTTEKMGFVGRGEGIAAMAIVLLMPKLEQNGYHH